MEKTYSKVTVVLRNRQIVFLDRLTADIRSATGSVVRRAEIIRSLVDALEESPVPVSEVHSGADLKTAIRRLAAEPFGSPK
jgi:hypothetical protein